ncbi:MAG: thiamine-phosphate pyrophosphorylase [Dehalococcoidia bacterium]|nr:thiamine-phosphate pyrophosphorylase [Dehalococcoidia bacterium]
MRHRILRTIDANINRVSEGLRVLEDVARFIAEDASSSKQLKSIRHQLSKSAGDLNLELLSNRDVPGDIGARLDLTTDHQDLTAVIRANSKRVEEGLRVLEELAKLPEMKTALSAPRLKESRYVVYSLEKKLISELSHPRRSRIDNQEDNHGRKKQEGK